MFTVSSNCLSPLTCHVHFLNLLHLKKVLLVIYDRLGNYSVIYFMWQNRHSFCDISNNANERKKFALKLILIKLTHLPNNLFQRHSSAA